jgi:hypothetical protein
MLGWRVFWVPTKTFVGTRQISVLTGWDDLHSREEQTGSTQAIRSCCPATTGWTSCSVST